MQTRNNKNMQATPNNEQWQGLTTPSIPPTRCEKVLA